MCYSLIFTQAYARSHTHTHRVVIGMSHRHIHKRHTHTHISRDLLRSARDGDISNDATPIPRAVRDVPPHDDTTGELVCLCSKINRLICMRRTTSATHTHSTKWASSTLAHYNNSNNNAHTSHRSIARNPPSPFHPCARVVAVPENTPYITSSRPRS